MPYFDIPAFYLYIRKPNVISMSKRTFFKRYLWIFDTIKNNQYISLEGIIEKFEHSGFKEDDNMGFSSRTFKRDKQEIAELFGIEILYDTFQRGYFIECENLTPSAGLLLDSYRLINTYQVFKDIDRFIAVEPRKSGSEHLLMMLDAIQNRKRIEFTYRKYVDESLDKRIIEPYFVKEFKNRWYVIARDNNDRQIKSFALDRIERDPIPISPSASFDIPSTITSESFYKDTFGIFKLPDAKVEEIELSFKPLKGKYIKSQPLHHSQKIIFDSETELRVKLKLHITHDFIMDLLSHGSELKIISPESLRSRIIEELNNSLNSYIN